ncbi:hypothetical protein COCC4DRAFT_56836 [Bipolaris maydis ATCC 48331]|uniref:Uncharacterized protein n=2 Tax=Cochliobolus heterostrophus TaxID=5016 RepID=M2URG2_COCH5|nr:uncharacterized protein COCC4DRAFT_56836 [Bipolaris maydis ATCC 48331]EMD90477.1 hypothetical protein COCHEDRAFT_1031785 [Bipolaris maydis C5]ENI09311.1 hypothetical protein COCC4DRAFT_56836 [Bipolaris maydis ATCC 48331]KAJ6206384.1 hypothetical protein PSV09DRAFT_1031785 [Bipolaris maydis]
MAKERKKQVQESPQPGPSAQATCGRIRHPFRHSDRQSLLLAPFLVVFPVTRVGVGTRYVFWEWGFGKMGTLIGIFTVEKGIGTVVFPYGFSFTFLAPRTEAQDRGARVNLTIRTCNMDDATLYYALVKTAEARVLPSSALHKSMHNYTSIHLRIYVSTLDSSVAHKWRCTLRPLYLACAIPDSASSRCACKIKPSMIEFGARLQTPNRNQKEKKRGYYANTNERVWLPRVKRKLHTKSWNRKDNKTKKSFDKTCYYTRCTAKKSSIIALHCLPIRPDSLFFDLQQQGASLALRHNCQ